MHCCQLAKHIFGQEASDSRTGNMVQLEKLKDVQDEHITYQTSHNSGAAHLPAKVHGCFILTNNMINDALEWLKYYQTKGILVNIRHQGGRIAWDNGASKL